MATANPKFSLVSSEDIEGAKVLDPNGENIGEIDQLLIDRVSGNVRYAIMSFGGFLGLGNRKYPLPWGSLKYDSEHEGFIANVTQQQLKDAPQFGAESWTDREWESRWHRHFQTRPYWEEGEPREPRKI
jgi:hypothetical protein